MKYLFLIVLVFVTSLSCPAATEESLESELKSLQIPENQMPPVVSDEKLYAVQTRYVPLKNRVAFDIGGAKNYNSSSFLTSQELNASLYYYFTDRFYTAVYGSYVFSDLSEAGTKLWQTDQIFPDICQITYRADATMGYHLFYGKFRLSMDTVFYFDQYIALGAGGVETTNGISKSMQPAAVADVGMAFWFGRHWSARLGVKDYYFKEIRRKSSDMVHHLLGHISIGFVFGGGGGDA